MIALLAAVALGLAGPPAAPALAAAEAAARPIVEGAAAPDSAATLPELRTAASEHEQARRFAEAIAANERILALRPKDPEATVRLARLSAWTGDLDRAIVLYRDALAHAPDDAGLGSDLADVLSWAHRYDESERLYEKVLALHPAYREALKGLTR